MIDKWIHFLSSLPNQSIVVLFSRDFDSIEVRSRTVQSEAGPRKMTLRSESNEEIGFDLDRSKRSRVRLWRLSQSFAKEQRQTWKSKSNEESEADFGPIVCVCVARNLNPLAFSLSRPRWLIAFAVCTCSESSKRLIWRPKGHTHTLAGFFGQDRVRPGSTGFDRTQRIHRQRQFWSKVAFIWAQKMKVTSDSVSGRQAS